jgi:hypothetical protein
MRTMKGTAMHALDKIPPACALALALLCTSAVAGGPAAGQVAPHAAPADGQRDFDFEIGTWKTHVSRRLHPLSGSTEWVELDGTSVVRKLLDGRANLVELDIAGPSGRITGVSLRLYNPEARQWSLNYSSIGAGTLSAPLFGEFRNRRGEFFGQDTLGTRTIQVRFVITCATPDNCRFEQSFSGDGGANWEINWIATDTRTKGDAAGAE